jgi:hypothetical protein
MRAQSQAKPRCDRAGGCRVEIPSQSGHSLFNYEFRCTMSALPPRADMCSATRDVCFVPIADILASQRDVRSYLDCVAKLFAALRSRNNRIRLNGALNQCCAFAFVLESILLILVVKIVLQHNRHLADMGLCAANVRFGWWIQPVDATLYLILSAGV